MVSSLKSSMVGVLTTQKLANATDQVLYLLRDLLKILPIHYWLHSKMIKWEANYLGNMTPAQSFGEILQFSLLHKSSSSINFTITAGPQKGMSIWDIFGYPLSPHWALLSKTLPFDSHMSVAGQYQIGKIFAILIKLWIWQVTYCCRGWKSMSQQAIPSWKHPLGHSSGDFLQVVCMLLLLQVMSGNVFATVEDWYQADFSLSS